MPTSLTASMTILLAALLPAIAPAQPTMVISSAIFPPFTTETNDGFEDRMITELYRRAGFSADVRRLPDQRGLLLVEDGYIDSTFSRVKSIIKNFKHMVQMEEPVFRRDFVVFSKNKAMKIENWDSLAPYSIAFMNGWKILEWNAKKYQSLTKTSSPEQMFKLLSNDRVDAVIFAKYSGLYLIQQLGLTDISIVGKPLASKDMALILNEKHKDLVPRLDSILREMKRDGTYQKAFDATIGPLLK